MKFASCVVFSLLLVCGVSAGAVDAAEAVRLDLSHGEMEVAASLASDDGRLSNGELFDVYLLELTQGTEVSVEAHSTEVDLVLRVHSPVGRRWMNDDAERGTVDPRLEFTAEEDGAHRVIVHAFGGYEEGPYSLLVTLSDH